MLTRQITRKAELELLEPLLASGSPQVLYIHGISGIGKTTLLQQLGQKHLLRSRGHWLPLHGQRHGAWVCGWLAYGISRT
ncbi:ATP-binding protein [Oceanospirillaceae bacterium]|nr:ATP-binding protein [Oceanospirillaceae bacterium]